jgi:hypothetical protein
MCSLIYPGSTPADVFLRLPFTMTAAELRDIASWDDVVRTAPQYVYVIKQLGGTLTRVDTIEANPTCPFCASPADNEMDETTFFCSERCPASCNVDNFEPIIQVTSSFRIDFEGARNPVTATYHTS